MALKFVVYKVYKANATFDDPAVKYAYNLGAFGIGNLYSVSNGLVAATTEAYDLMGRAKRVVKSITDAPQSSYATLYDYDLAGKTQKITYPGGYYVTYGYHPGTGLLSAVTGSDSTQFASFTSYLASAKTAHVDYGNGAQTTYAYDPQSARLTGILTSNSGQTPIFNKSYAYSAAGDITQITDLRANSAYAYEYDALHRLTAEANLYGATATTASILSFEYTAGSVHGPDRITDEIYDAQYDLGYDGNGNQTSGVDLTNPAQPVDRTIHYNAGNMPTRIDMGGVQASAITYDGENARAVKASTGSSTYYINPYFEIENGVETRYIFGNNTRIARIKGADTLYFHKDHLGSTAVLTGSNGLEIAPPTGYLPYGMDRNSNGQAVSGYKFTDQEQDHETGLYNYDARLYDPVTALFVSPDPYLSANLASGENVDFGNEDLIAQFSNPKRLNRYAYCLNNPLSYIDPLGLYESTPYLSWVPGQYLFDQGMTALENGQYGWAAAYFGGMASEQALFVLTLGGGSSAGKIGQETIASKGLPPLRQQYVDAVDSLANKVPEMREAGMSSEGIARTLHAERRALGEQFKALTPPDKLAEIYERNLGRYGDKLGPSTDWLRNEANKTWEQIIESATRSGGKDLGF